MIDEETLQLTPEPDPGSAAPVQEPDAPVPDEAGPEPETQEPAPACFMDRELSWLQFNLRVLNEAGDTSVPLLERLKFLAIYRSNMEEFFMVRVGSLTHRSILLPEERDEKTGWTAAEQLEHILAEVARQQEIEVRIYRHLLQDMHDAGIDVLDPRKMDKVDEVVAKKFFSEIRPLLSPRVVDAEHPFPFIANKEICVAVALSKKGEKGDSFRLGLIPLFRLPAYRSWEIDSRQKVILTSDIVQHYASLLFKKLEVRESALFQVTRNADVFIDDDLRSYDADFRQTMEKMLRKRKRQQPVRLMISGRTSARFRAALIKALKVPEANVFVRKMPFDLSYGSGIRKEPGMKYEERRSQRTVKLKKGEFLPYLRKHDVLLSYPFQSMTAFVDMLYEAADDPDVAAIRITLYRLSSSSKVASALAYAADRGKEVLCLLELRARFDERNNIDYSEVLEDAGCHVIYGLPEMKVHSKLCLIVRRNGTAVEYITQVGTGNYNETTSEQYTDLSLITSREDVGRDAAQVFEALATGQVPAETEALWVAPKSFRSRVLEFLEREIEKGPEGRVTIKVNSMNDLTVMRALIRASRAGVQVELFIRGICCLLPGVPGYTENISVRSVVGRYLEHSRIFIFGEGEDQRIFIGSGDLLNRNTQRRVEAFIECVTPDTREEVLEIVRALREDREKSWTMASDGSYAKTGPVTAGTASQDRLYEYFGSKIIEELPQAPAKRKGWFWRLFHGKEAAT